MSYYFFSKMEPDLVGNLTHQKTRLKSLENNLIILIIITIETVTVGTIATVYFEFCGGYTVCMRTKARHIPFHLLKP